MALAKKLYDRSPIWLENLMVSFQGLLHNRMRWDAGLVRELLGELLRSQWWNEAEFAEYQTEKLREHIRYSAANVPYYRELFRKEGIDPDSIRSIQDLLRIPLLEKETVRNSPGSFLNGGRPLKSWNRLFTSGTTGSPMELYSSKASFTRVWSFVCRLRQWAGLEDPVYPRRAQFTGRDIVPDKQIQPDGIFWRRNIPGNALLFSTSHLSLETAPSYANALSAFRPELIDGYPSAILVVARCARELGLRLPSPKAIITSAETLFEDHRQEIEAAFGCPVFNQYASSDTGAFVCDCERGNLHINPEFGICEALKPDGSPAGPGEQGEIVTTSFCNTEQLFIRYKIGDTAIMGPAEACPCGRKMPRVEAVIGRTDDILYLPSRGFVGRLDPVFKSLKGILEAQIIHEAPDLLRVKLVPAVEYDQTAEQEFEANLRKKVGHVVEIVIEPTSAIPRGPNGKFPSVISLCRDTYPRFQG